MTTYSRQKAAASLVTARRASPSMFLVEGIPGVSARVLYRYRGHLVTRTYRPHDVRNKTNNGYWYSVEFTVGGGVYNLPTRAAAKQAIDSHEDSRR